ncbi:MAG: CHAT domain-containing protein, partial [Bacteroidota bacterium]
MQYIDSALVILEQNISPYSQAYRFALWEYAAIQQSLEQYAIAASTLRRIAVLEEKTLEVATKSLPERDLELYTLEYLGFLSRSMELAKDYPQIADLCYDKILFYKGFLLDHALTLRRYAQQDEQTKSLYKRLRGTNRELTQLYTNTGADADRVSELEILAEQLEQELARAQPKNYEQSFDLSWRDIQQRLTPNEASLEIAASIEYSETGEAVDYNYAGIMVLPEVDFPIYFPLCSQTDFDSVFTVKTSSEDAINNLYQWDGQGQQLYQLIWQPIAEYLENYPAIKRIYFSNDGTFHRINIGALPTSERQVVGQQYELIQLTTTRGLLAENARQMASDKSAVLFGGISYGKLDESTASAAPIMENEDSRTSTRRRSDTQKIRGYEPTNGYWQELPWTEVEINYAQEVLAEAGYAVNMYTGAKATEEQFKSISDDAASPTVIHLATHGYFFAEPEDESGQRTLPFAQAKINLIRSGLILADGNYAWVNGSGRNTGPEDGVLTALEVSQLELDETELVILSACETGLGDIRRNEGVYGLQRALKKAGVQYT